MDWLAVETKPNYESLAQLSLERLKVETFFPKIRQEKLIRRVRKTVIGPLFPRYLFARFDLDIHFRAVNYAQGVRRVVVFGSTPVVVNESIIESLRSRLSEGFVTIKKQSYSPGQIVIINEGPLSGLEAIFKKEMSGQRRAVLLLRALSNARVVIDLDYVVNL